MSRARHKTAPTTLPTRAAQPAGNIARGPEFSLLTARAAQGFARSRSPGVGTPAGGCPGQDIKLRPHRPKRRSGTTGRRGSTRRGGVLTKKTHSRNGKVPARKGRKQGGATGRAEPESGAPKRVVAPLLNFEPPRSPWAGVLISNRTEGGQKELRAVARARRAARGLLPSGLPRQRATTWSF